MSGSGTQGWPPSGGQGPAEWPATPADSPWGDGASPSAGQGAPPHFPPGSQGASPFAPSGAAPGYGQHPGWGGQQAGQGSSQYGAGPYGSPQGYPGSGSPYGGGAGYPSGPGGPAGPGGYSAYGAPPPKKGNALALIIGGLVLLAAIAVGILFATGVLGGGGDDTPPQGQGTTQAPVAPTTPAPTAPAPTTPAPTTPAPTTPAPTTPAPTTPAPTTPAPTTPPAGGGLASSGDTVTDAYYTACEGGDMVNCDRLYWRAEYGSDLEEFASTCAGTSAETYGSCAAEGAEDGRETYGTDPGFDLLWDLCAAGDMYACDELFFDAPIFSEYSDFGGNCGNTKEGAYGTCQ